MTCYGHDGTRRWQQRTDASAPGDPGVVASLALFHSVAALRGGARGWGDARALLTPSGYRLNAFKLPGKPVAALLVVDVDGDG